MATISGTIRYLALLLICITLSFNGTVSAATTKSHCENEDEDTDDELPVKKLPCDEDQLMNYLAQIQAINPETIVNMATKDPVNKVCSKLKESINEMDKYIDKCEPLPGKDLYMQLIKGVHSLHTTLCGDKKFKCEFSNYANCLSQLHEEFEECAGPADWEEREKCKLCESYEEISDCYYIKAATLCGTKAATTFKKLVCNVFNTIVMVHCDNVKKNPIVDEVMPDEVASGTLKVPLFISTILFASLPHAFVCSTFNL